MSITLAEDVAVSAILMMCSSGVGRGKKGRRIVGKLMKGVLVVVMHPNICMFAAAD